MDSVHSAFLPEPYRQTFERVFANPVSPVLTWAAVRALLDHLGAVGEGPNGILTFTWQGQSLILRQPANEGGTAPELVTEIRQFLQHTPAVTDVARAGDWLVVIDRLGARVFRSVATGATAQFFRSYSGTKAGPGSGTSFCVNGHEPAGLLDYFEPLAAVLQGAGRIMFFGRAASMGSETASFIAWLRRLDSALGRRIVAVELMDLEELGEDSLLGQARAIFCRIDEGPAEQAAVADASDHPARRRPPADVTARHLSR